ncbi:MAG TPA: CBS domain-containing protein [Nitrosomonas sp.]|nr:CBS domain-containing protein [Nitrosomonas sp.]HQX13045.1 CBS domain-containing protein [Nitrosomonas sp.]HRB20435.1 CBS domain-containing protein [Nitrosomonas sp.]HRB32765.1 CBS domain-containing protein [Nitrosomonas sp.]HRB45164.1 CBS domain-containing protein [Nitrosomonas sp.]
MLKEKDYKPLAMQYFNNTVQISHPTPPISVTFDSPALNVMTDLRKIQAAVISPDVSMEIANTYMIQRGVRTLLVVHDNQSLVGIITATDILGEKPMRFVQQRNIKHNEILVADIMTPLKKLEAIPLEEVEHARVGNIVASLYESGRLHALVAGSVKHLGLSTICGIFSWTQIEKQLGRKITIPVKVAKSFAEIESTLIAN